MTFKELTRRVHMNAVEKGRCKEDRAMSNTLLPCPFCGGEAAARDIKEPSANGWVGCQRCRCFIDWVKNGKPQAIAAWNHRAQPAKEELI